MSKAGPSRLLTTPIRAADHARRHDPQLARIYYIQMTERGAGHLKATCVVAAHLAERAWAVMDRGTPYVICDNDGNPSPPRTPERSSPSAGPSPRRSANAAAAASRRERLLNRPYGLAHEATFPGPDPLALPAASSTTPEPPPTPARMSRPAIRPWRHAGIPQGLRTCPSPRPSLTRTKPKTSAS